MKYHPKIHHRRSIVRAGLKPAPAEIHHRRSNRLPGYDYSQPGAYYVTLCAYNRECMFGEIINGEMILNENGRIVENCWLDLPNHYQNIQLDYYIVMPNHFHGIIMINSVCCGIDGGVVDDSGVDDGDVIVGAGLKPAPTTTTRQPVPTTRQPAPKIPSDPAIPVSISPNSAIPAHKDHGLSEFVRALKTFSSKQINQIRNTSGMPVWQRNYWDHIIRDKKSLKNIRKYIINNPAKWEEDEKNPRR